MQHRCTYVGNPPTGYHYCTCKCGANSFRTNHGDPWDTDMGCRGELLWAEDDALTYDAPGLAEEYAKYTGRAYNTKDAIARIDVGDGEYLLMPTGVVVLATYAGAGRFWKAEGLRLYLDDTRDLPEALARAGYFKLNNPAPLLRYIGGNGLGSLEIISLDNDLGCKIEGRHVLNEIERRTFEFKEFPPVLMVHSANIAARASMQVVIDRLAVQAFQALLEPSDKRFCSKHSMFRVGADFTCWKCKQDAALAMRKAALLR